MHTSFCAFGKLLLESCSGGLQCPMVSSSCDVLAGLLIRYKEMSYYSYWYRLAYHLAGPHAYLRDFTWRTTAI